MVIFSSAFGIRVHCDQTALLLASIDGLRNDSNKNRYIRPLSSSKCSFLEMAKQQKEILIECYPVLLKSVQRNK